MDRSTAKTEVVWELPSEGTHSLNRYTDYALKTFSFFHFIVHTVLRGDAMPMHLEEILDQDKTLDQLTPPLELAKTNPGPGVLELRKNIQQLYQTSVSRLVDNFQCYVADLLRECFAKDGRILTSSTPSLSVEYVSSFSSIDSLFDDLIDRKVNELTYKGYSELSEWCEKRGIPLNIGTNLSQAVVKLIAIRNLNSHSRCVVDRKFVETTGIEADTIGKLYILTGHDLYDAFRILGTAAKTIDSMTSEKFGLDIIARVSVKPELDTQRG